MGLVLLIVVAILLLGTGGGFYGYRQYGGPGVGGAVALVILAFFVVWLAGAFTSSHALLGSGAPIFVILGIH